MTTTSVENKPKAFLFVLSCVVLWAFIPVVSRLGQQDLDNYQFLFWSSLLSFVVLFLAVLLTGKFQILKTYTRIKFSQAFGLGFLGAFLYYLLLYFGYANAKGLEVLVLQYTWPIFVLLFSSIFLKEKIGMRNFIAIALGFLGILVVLTKGHFESIYLGSLSTDLIVLFGASCFGLFSVLSKKANFEPYTATMLFFLSATLFSFIAMLCFSDFAVPSKSSLMPVLLNGIFINGFSYLFWLKGLQFARATFVAPFVFLTPVLASVLIILFFREMFLPVYVLGLVLVVSAGLLSK